MFWIIISCKRCRSSSLLRRKDWSALVSHSMWPSFHQITNEPLNCVGLLTRGQSFSSSCNICETLMAHTAQFPRWIMSHETGFDSPPPLFTAGGATTPSAPCHDSFSNYTRPWIHTVMGFVVKNKTNCNKYLCETCPLQSKDQTF